ncbi:LysE family translocator [Goodfellowiella coeruleoviolacea]|uniref:Threonine/homoserine/homoserine lactone efflux protein n=1 Tax=Goodfellowiella coeruleoviolacea TaxID=334858 RepID=A0AAE3GJT4_9PSEU|nr:LysE family translocator [Goodfellowiella coeruleoviolacea]MCP2169561.1 Threonine/homoserine/homoserine lactone efflux protein [Goodfellowiella coeruleoviolacea]
MSGAALLGYALAAFLLTVKPGLDTMLVLRNVVTSGPRVGMASGVGITLGCVVWGAASVAGLTALLAASRLAYDVVRFAGAGYLLWLGGSALWRSWRDRGGPAPDSGPVAGPAPVTPLVALRTGLVTNLLNPAVGVFYLSLLPQFLPADGGGAAGWSALLVAIHVGLGLVWQLVLVWAAGRATAVLRRPRVKRWLDRITATALIGFGVRVAVEGR